MLGASRRRGWSLSINFSLSGRSRAYYRYAWCMTLVLRRDKPEAVGVVCLAAVGEVIMLTAG